jgi:hypothetical protein
VPAEHHSMMLNVRVATVTLPRSLVRPRTVTM